MKSFCIKTNNKKIINYLLNNIEHMPLDEVYFINKQFKIYKNVIVHYKGNNENLFFNYLSNIITDCIINYYEDLFLKKIINFNYFYFDDFEKKIILNNCYEYINEEDDEKLIYRKDEIWVNVLRYIVENKSIILDGFVTFRIPEYHETLDYIVDYAVNEYIIEKEYTEFINLLKLYIESKESQTNLLHLVYTNGESILLDNNRNTISLKDYSFNAKYLSDITFSSNDYALNTLLTLLPRKLEIHLLSYEDEFINTLKLVFGSRVTICTDCNICRTYKVLNNIPLDVPSGVPLGTLPNG